MQQNANAVLPNFGTCNTQLLRTAIILQRTFSSVNSIPEVCKKMSKMAREYVCGSTPRPIRLPTMWMAAMRAALVVTSYPCVEVLDKNPNKCALRVGIGAVNSSNSNAADLKPDSDSSSPGGTSCSEGMGCVDGMTSTSTSSNVSMVMNVPSTVVPAIRVLMAAGLLL